MYCCEHIAGITVSFTQDHFAGSEMIEFVLVTVELTGGTSAFTFGVGIIPLEQSPVSAEGI